MPIGPENFDIGNERFQTGVLRMNDESRQSYASLSLADRETQEAFFKELKDNLRASRNPRE